MVLKSDPPKLSKKRDFHIAQKMSQKCHFRPKKTCKICQKTRKTGPDRFYIVIVGKTVLKKNRRALTFGFFIPKKLKKLLVHDFDKKTILTPNF